MVEDKIKQINKANEPPKPKRERKPKPPQGSKKTPGRPKTDPAIKKANFLAYHKRYYEEHVKNNRPKTYCEACKNNILTQDIKRHRTGKRHQVNEIIASRLKDLIITPNLSEVKED